MVYCFPHFLAAAVGSDGDGGFNRSRQRFLSMGYYCMAEAFRVFDW